MTLLSLNFDNAFVRELPGDTDTRNIPRPVENALHSKVIPRKASAPSLVAISPEAAGLLDLDPQKLMEDPATPQILSGSQLIKGMEPFAMAYGGHQFGSWAGQLGDGRAINLGEVLTAKGQRWMLQLKGAGPTPYSRTADGLAVLRSSIREFLCSEAMHHLGIPTTRALSLVLTGDQVERDMFYDGRPKMEPGAVVCRLSPSFTRFGSFQLPASRGDTTLVKKLLDYTMDTDSPGQKIQYMDWFQTLCQKTLDLVIHWMRVGFVHGVLNTDNMSTSGLTIDYGPYGWLEGYDPSWTPNTTDAQGRRYCFGNQGDVALWNLVQLANAIHPVTGDEERLKASLMEFQDQYPLRWEKMMAKKLGFFGLKEEVPREIKKLIQNLLDLFKAVETDFTLFFRGLGEGIGANALPSELSGAFYPENQWESMEKFRPWWTEYQSLLNQYPMDREKRKDQMDQLNPKYVLRNYLAQGAIERAEAGDFSGVHDLLTVMKQPYTDQRGREGFAQKRPEWARHKPGCSMLSCSS